MINVSVPGKIHLIGEHSAVYGKGAILASVNLYLHVKIQKSRTKIIVGIHQYDNAIKNMQLAIEQKIKQKFPVRKIPNYKIAIDTSGIPVGSGLGTSASLSAAFSECLLKFLKIKYSKDNLFEIAFEGEKVFHGNPSGGDLAAVLNEGLTYFKRNPDSSKIIKPVFMNPCFSGDDGGGFILIDSGKPEEKTSDMVSLVSLRSASKLSSNHDKIFDYQEDLANQMIQVLREGDQNKFAGILKAAERNLERIGVVGKTAKTIIRDIEKLGAAAKITGAGGIKKGSGMILAYHKDLNKLIEFAKSKDLKYYPIEISKEGDHK